MPKDKNLKNIPVHLQQTVSTRTTSSVFLTSALKDIENNPDHDPDNYDLQNLILKEYSKIIEFNRVLIIHSFWSVQICLRNFSKKLEFACNRPKFYEETGLLIILDSPISYIVDTTTFQFKLVEKVNEFRHYDSQNKEVILDSNIYSFNNNHELYLKYKIKKLPEPHAEEPFSYRHIFTWKNTDSKYLYASSYGKIIEIGQNSIKTISIISEKELRAKIFSNETESHYCFPIFNYPNNYFFTGLYENDEYYNQTDYREERLINNSNLVIYNILTKEKNVITNPFNLKKSSKYSLITFISHTQKNELIYLIKDSSRDYQQSFMKLDLSSLRITRLYSLNKHESVKKGTIEFGEEVNALSFVASSSEISESILLFLNNGKIVKKSWDSGAIMDPDYYMGSDKDELYAEQPRYYKMTSSNVLYIDVKANVLTGINNDKKRYFCSNSRLEKQLRLKDNCEFELLPNNMHFESKYNYEYVECEYKKPIAFVGKVSSVKLNLNDKRKIISNENIPNGMPRYMGSNSELIQFISDRYISIYHIKNEKVILRISEIKDDVFLIEEPDKNNQFLDEREFYTEKPEFLNVLLNDEILEGEEKDKYIERFMNPKITDVLFKFKGLPEEVKKEKTNTNELNESPSSFQIKSGKINNRSLTDKKSLK